MDAMFKPYRRKQIAELRMYIPGEGLTGSLEGVSISEQDKIAGSPRPGDMIARNPKNHKDQWLVAKQYFEDNFEPADAPCVYHARPLPQPSNFVPTKDFASGVWCSTHGWDCPNSKGQGVETV